MEECARMRPYEDPPKGVGDAVAIGWDASKVGRVVIIGTERLCG